MVAGAVQLMDADVRPNSWQTHRLNAIGSFRRKPFVGDIQPILRNLKKAVSTRNVATCKE